MFYELIGTLLGQAAEALSADPPGDLGDERAQRGQRQLTTLLRRIGAIWPDLFSALEEECSILEETVRGTAEAARMHGVVRAESRAIRGSSDPLTRYRELLCELDEWVILLHERGEEPWAGDALRALRRGLADAFEVQGRLVDGMLAA